VAYSFLCWTDQTPPVTYYTSEYLFIMLMFHPLNLNTIEFFMCHLFPVLLHAHFNPL